MIHQFCSKLKDRIVLANLPFAEFVAGVVKAVSYTEDEFNGNKITHTIPVSWETNASNCGENQPPERDLVPDSSKKGIVYFEESGLRVVGENASGFLYAGSVVLVCWYNKALITGQSHAHMQTSFIAMISQALNAGNGYFSIAPFSRVSISVESVLIQDGSVFSRYSYDEQLRQYLMPPFEHFALSLSVKFCVPTACLPSVNNTLPDDCRIFK